MITAFVLTDGPFGVIFTPVHDSDLYVRSPFIVRELDGWHVKAYTLILRTGTNAQKSVAFPLRKPYQDDYAEWGYAPFRTREEAARARDLYLDWVEGEGALVLSALTSAHNTLCPGVA